MRCEGLVFRRCCMCIPLRYGLIAWGYLRLVLASFLLCGLSFTLDKVINRVTRPDRIYDILIFSFFIIVLIVDIIMGILFIIGCHTKNLTLIKKYYYHNLFLLGLFIVACLMSIAGSMYFLTKYGVPFVGYWLYVISDICGTFAYVLIQVYIILLVRSQFIKLNVACEFRFENKATEAECSVNMGGLNEPKMTDYNKKGKINVDDEIRNYV